MKSIREHRLYRRFLKLRNKARYMKVEIAEIWNHDSDELSAFSFISWVDDQMEGCDVGYDDVLFIRVDKKKGLSPENLIVQIRSDKMPYVKPFPMSDQLAAAIRRFAKAQNRFSCTYVGKVYGLSASTVWNLCVGKTHQNADFYELPLSYNWNDLNTMVKKYRKIFGEDKDIYVNNKTGEFIVRDTGGIGVTIHTGNKRERSFSSTSVTPIAKFARQENQTMQ